MTQVNGNYGTAPVYGNQQTYGAQPVTYAPGISTPYSSDQVRLTQQPSSGGGLFGGTKRQLVTRESVIIGAAGAGIGFLVGGPMGAVIGGIIGLLISVFSNFMKSNQSGQIAGNVPAQQGYFSPQQTQPTANDEYYRRMQQQQMQQQ